MRNSLRLTLISQIQGWMRVMPSAFVWPKAVGNACYFRALPHSVLTLCLMRFENGVFPYSLQCDVELVLMGYT